MEIFKSNPYTNGVRHYINIKKNLLSKTSNLSKEDITGFKRFHGRSSNTGRITVRHSGGGCKKRFRNLDFSDIRRNGIVTSIIHDPFRNSFVSLNFDLVDKNFFRNITTNHVGPGAFQICGYNNVELKLGNRAPLKHIPAGSIMHSLSIGSSIKYARSAGLFFQLLQKNMDTCRVRLPSGLIKEISNSSFGTLGTISNMQHNLISIGKAGRSRMLGVRPTVRGIAMNPVDHPHGGRSNGGKPCVTPWGIPTKGKPTVKKKL
jgi:large subunit ribosomal protein L2